MAVERQTKPNLGFMNKGDRYETTDGIYRVADIQCIKGSNPDAEIFGGENGGGKSHPLILSLSLQSELVEMNARVMDEGSRDPTFLLAFYREGEVRGIVDECENKYDNMRGERRTIEQNKETECGKENIDNKPKFEQQKL
ncbi:hypothetical protein CEXT_538851 [Caerostris extrusa]|uniref:Uncharacterized protein n=1 Tax=Caerostris extrusa TaxID=172846 RepID=A0AAV4VPB9_CAEEX|nr:hypothetical protein CEXT_538851 [Caerostris extrusa]